MRLHEILEAYADKESGEVYRWFDRVKLFERFIGDSSVFVHFSNINKLGINPRSSFDTPFGIYGYPIGYVVERFNKQVGKVDVPFAGERSFAHIFRVRDVDKCWTIGRLVPGSIADIRSKLRDCRDYLLKLSEAAWFANLQLDDRQDEFEDFPDDHLSDEFVRGLVGPGLRWLGPDVKFPELPVDEFFVDRLGFSAGQLNSLKCLFVGLDRFRSVNTSSPDDLLWRLSRVAGEFLSKRGPVGWSKVLSGLGCVGVIDPGFGVIHPSEPCQAVFFRLGDLELLKSVDNSGYSGSNVGVVGYVRSKGLNADIVCDLVGAYEASNASKGLEGIVNLRDDESALFRVINKIRKKQALIFSDDFGHDIKLVKTHIYSEGDPIKFVYTGVRADIASKYWSEFAASRPFDSDLQDSVKNGGFYDGLKVNVDVPVDWDNNLIGVRDYEEILVYAVDLFDKYLKALYVMKGLPWYNNVYCPRRHPIAVRQLVLERLRRARSLMDDWGSSPILRPLVSLFDKLLRVA